MITYYKLIDAVIDLHGIAAVIEHEIGQGQLSDDVRQCADRLSALLKRENNDGTRI